MANTIILKNSSVASKIPLASDLDLGEVAINTTDGKLFTKKGDGSVIEVGASTGSGVSNALFSPSTELLFTTSRTWVAPFTGTVKVTAIGGGGGGAIFYSENSVTGLVVTGGGAGGCARGEYSITQGDSYTITIGNGGGARITTGVGYVGYSTSITGTGIGLVANGGSGGTYTNNPAAGALGGAGGTASGGQYNFTGGNGGDIRVSASTDLRSFTTGGGAVGLTEDGYPGGSIGRTSNNDLIYGSAATGGAGVGGKSGDLTRNSNFSLASGGGSAYGSYPDNAGYSYPITNLPHYNFGPKQNGASIFDVTGHGGQPVPASVGIHYVFGMDAYAGGPGGGGGGNIDRTQLVDQGGYSVEFMQGGDGGVFGGGGACVLSAVNPSTTLKVYGGHGGIGGGGGACLSRDSTSKASSGGGGLGLVAIQYTSVS